MQVEIWSDVVCPWCHIGKRRFEAALADFEHADEVEVTWRSFELDPQAATHVETVDYAQRLAAKYGTSRDQAQQMIDTMTASAAAEGLDFHFERAVPANTFDAHQVIHLAAEHGVQDAVKERLLTAYFSEGAAVGDRDVLVEQAARAGLDADEVRSALSQQTYAPAVRADESEARALGISGVPFFVIDRRYAVSGAQPSELLAQTLRQAWAEAHPLQTVGTGQVCGPEGCRD